MSAHYDDEMILLPEGDSREPQSEEEALIQLIMEATADVFTKISYLLRETRKDVPEEALPAFREIVGAACRAHGDVIIECLPEQRRKFLCQLADALSERSLDAIAERRAAREQPTADVVDPMSKPDVH